MNTARLRGMTTRRTADRRVLAPIEPVADRKGTDAAKRVVDVVISAAALVALAPLIAVVALLVKRDGGTVFFRQLRVGEGGRTFAFYKFRSMVADAEARRRALDALNQHGAAAVTFKMKDDPRITPIGRFLRRTSLDELPQLWNVLKGDMSLVGPRPAIPEEVARYSNHERGRLGVKPGITGIWQVQGRAEIPFEKQVELDLDYINRRSVWLDAALLLQTIPAVLTGRGAY